MLAIDVSLTGSAIKAELQQLYVKGCFRPVRYNNLPPADTESVVRSFCFLKQKMNADGRPTKFKARLVGNGRRQSFTDDDHIESPTAQPFLCACCRRHGCR
jgi:hypothetical protein